MNRELWEQPKTALEKVQAHARKSGNTRPQRIAQSQYWVTQHSWLIDDWYVTSIPVAQQREDQSGGKVADVLRFTGNIKRVWRNGSAKVVRTEIIFARHS